MSTVILNWNRLDLLRITVHSYLASVSVPFELMIVDNCSSDGSQRFIRPLAAGEIWEEHESTPVIRRSQIIDVPGQNVGTTCMLPRRPSTTTTLAAETG
jgi:GT2 family glycosyltransferase